MVETDRAKQYSLLITDDDLSWRETLRDVFEPRGYRTLLASCGEEAIDIVRVEPVDLALLDMHMPTLDGLETLRLVKQIKAFLPCIIVTGDLSEMLRREALSAQAFSVISKPLSIEIMVETVRDAIRDAYAS